MRLMEMLEHAGSIRQSADTKADSTPSRDSVREDRQTDEGGKRHK